MARYGMKPPVWARRPREREFGLFDPEVGLAGYEEVLLHDPIVGG